MRKTFPSDDAQNICDELADFEVFDEMFND